MASHDKVHVTCALTGVLTDPAKHPVPVTVDEMATAAKQAYDAGASIMHCHFRRQEPGCGSFPSLEHCRPEMAALNAGSLNYLKLRSDGSWAWPPMLFDNPVPKVEAFLAKMREYGIVPECECFDTGILRSVDMFQKAGLLPAPAHISLVMGVASGMPAKPAWLPLLIDEMPEGAYWQTIVIGRQEVWDVHRRSAELGGDLRTGVEDTFYLPDGSKTSGNGPLIEHLVRFARECGREIASPEDVRADLGLVQ
jgi:uncharacterized protein (DUF849 family)